MKIIHAMSEKKYYLLLPKTLSSMKAAGEFMAYKVQKIISEADVIWIIP